MTRLTLKGMAADTVIENVFICEDDETVIVSLDKSSKCPLCKKDMENAGWFEAGVTK